MKKLKKIKMLLVAMGLMGSLSFVNCYAVEKEGRDIKKIELNENVDKNLKEENALLKIENKTLVEKNEFLTRLHAAAEQLNEVLKEENQKLTRDVQELLGGKESLKLELNKEKEDLKKEIEDLKANNKLLSNKFKTTLLAKTLLKTENDSLKEQNKDLDEVNRYLLEENVKLEKATQDLDEGNKKLEEENKDLQREKNDLEKRNEDLTGKVDNLERKNRGVNEELIRYKNWLELKTTEKLLADRENTKLKDENVRLQNNLLSYRNKKLALQKFPTYKAQKRRLAQFRREMEGEYKDLYNFCSDLFEKYKDLRQKNKEGNDAGEEVNYQDKLEEFKYENLYNKLKNSGLVGERQDVEDEEAAESDSSI